MRDHWSRSLAHLISSLRKVANPCTVLASARDPLVTPLKQTNRPNSGQLTFTRLTQKGLRMAIICDGYPKVQVSSENSLISSELFLDLWMSSLRRHSPSASSIPTVLTGLSLWYTKIRPGTDWTAKFWHSMHWRPLGLKMVDWEANYKSGDLVSRPCEHREFMRVRRNLVESALGSALNRCLR